MINKKIGIIGCGNMGEALLSRLSQIVEKSTALMVSEADTSRRDYIQTKYKMIVEIDNNAVVKYSDIIILAVKPKDMDGLLQEIRATLPRDSQPLFISIAAGKPISYFESILGKQKIIRAMPNLSARVGKSATCFCANAQVATEDIAIAKEIFSSIGIFIQVDEGQLDAVTALSGAGPAYFFYFTQKLAEAGVAAGLDEKTALTLARQSFFGSSLLAETGGKPLEELMKEVATPGGTTEAALTVFEKEKLPAIFEKAIKAAKERSRELAKKK